ncbi:UTRA domain-containing protein [Crenobacter sp. SG2305]|uniref:UTRA domain-containing protein n=1 Tax=Crenobacter oryzisoli TaxID=3056844 RepID=UPI0025AA79A5|nr:UTRA domain-containing protein [Crenobacter sp. SG2305]MDN0083658.1 UTRA domain-containing protein [Crenobacter sp. SG2305]
MTATRSPRYQRIKTYLLDGIRSRQFLPGHKLPPELELARTFGVSRMTVSKAIRDLTEDGVLLRFAGDGTYVAESKVEASLVDNGQDIAAEIVARGHAYNAEQLLLETVPADEDVAARFALQPGAPVCHLLLLHREDGLGVQLEEHYFDPQWAADFTEQDFTRVTPLAFIQRRCPLTGLEHAVWAVLPNLAEQHLLGIPSNEPCLLVIRLVWSHHRLVSFVRLLHPGSRYMLHARAGIG